MNKQVESKILECLTLGFSPNIKLIWILHVVRTKRHPIVPHMPYPSSTRPWVGSLQTTNFYKSPYDVESFFRRRHFVVKYPHM